MQEFAQVDLWTHACYRDGLGPCLETVLKYLSVIDIQIELFQRLQGTRDYLKWTTNIIFQKNLAGATWKNDVQEIKIGPKDMLSSRPFFFFLACCRVAVLTQRAHLYWLYVLVRACTEEITFTRARALTGFCRYNKIMPVLTATV